MIQKAIEKAFEMHAMKKRGQGNLINGLIGLLVVAIVGVAVTFPVVQDVVNNSTASGTDALILGVLPTLVLVVLVLAFVGVMTLSRGR